MKKIHRILSVFLAVAMIIGALPAIGFNALAADIVKSGTCGENLTWTLDSEGTLTISGTGAIMEFYFSEPAPWFSASSDIYNVVINDGVTSIGWYAFAGCSGLTSITIPDGVTSIGEYAFYGCTGLNSVTIPDSVTSIGEYAFYECAGLESITVAADNAVYRAAGNCVIEMATNTLIAGCNNSVIPNDGSVTSIGYRAFFGCSGLTSVTIPDSVTSIGYHAFASCEGLNSVTIPDSVTSIGESAFDGCSGLTSVTIPASVTSIGESAFDGCSGLTSVTIPASVTSIGDYAFYECAGLTSVTIPASVTSIGDYAFYECAGLESITVAADNAVYRSAGNCLIETETGTLILGCKNSVIPNDGSVTNIGEGAFVYCSGLTSVTIPDGVTSIGEGAFGYCSGLTSVTIPDSMTSIGIFAFFGCESLSDVYYLGSEEEWNQVSVGSNNDPLLNAVFHFSTHSHTFGDWTLVAEATCTEKGSEVRVCAGCGYTETRETDALGHGYDLGFDVEEVASTCKVKGYYRKICLDCGDIVESRTYGLDPNNHVGGTEIRNASSATCAVNGYTGDTYCLGCGAKIADGEVINAPGHDWGDWRETTPATCTVAGSETRTCKRDGCGETETRATAALGHGYDLGFDVEEVASTCKVKGYYRKICLDCGDIVESRTYEHDPNNHVGGTEIRNASSATCAVNGYTGDTYCLGCGAKIADGEVINAPGHDWGDWRETTPATCTEAGEETRSCRRSSCDASETREIDALGHGYDLGFDVEEVASTCKVKGYYRKICLDCGDIVESRTYELDPNNHVGGTEIRNASSATCAVNGYTGDTYCLGCGAKIADGEVINALGHDFGEWVVTQEPTYLREGVRTRVCSRCPATETAAVEKLVPDETKTDEQTGSQLAFKEDVVPADTQLVVDEEFDGVYFQILNREKGNVRKQLFNITLESEGEKIQPAGYVLIRLPIPEGYNTAYLTVYYIATDGSGMEKLESYIDGNYICFETTHFSEYAIVDESPDQQEPAEHESNCICGEYHTGIFAGIITFFHRIIYFFKNLFK